jgi:hypothetical protein
MISFIKSNLTILGPLIMLFLTIDMFLLIFKFKVHSESILHLKISYDIFKSYYLGSYSHDEYKLAIVYLTIENTSASSTDIIKIRLIDGFKSYLATLPQIRNNFNEHGIILINEDDDECKLININILSENILNTPKFSSHNTLSGYAVFENVEPITDSKNYKIIIETHNKVFEKEITINPLNNDLHPV